MMGYRAHSKYKLRLQCRHDLGTITIAEIRSVTRKTD